MTYLFAALNRSGAYKKILLQPDFPIACNANETDLQDFAITLERYGSRITMIPIDCRVT